MATDDFEESYYDDEDEELRESVDNLQDTIKEYKNSSASQKQASEELAKGTRRARKPKMMSQSAAGSGPKQVADKIGEIGEKKAAKKSVKQQGGNQAGKQAAKQAGKQAAAKTAETTAKAGTVAKAGGAAAAQKGVEGVASKIHPIVAIIVAAVQVVRAIFKFVDRKAEKHGVSTKGLRYLFAAAPILSIFAIIYIILFAIMLLTHFKTYTKTEALQEAIVCAQGEGCEDFLGSGITISSAKSPLKIGNKDIADKIAEFNGKTLAASSKSTYQSKLGKSFTEDESKKLIYFTDIQIARLVVEYLMFENKYFGFTEAIGDIFVGESLRSKEVGFISWLFQLLVEHSIIGNVQEAYSLFNWLKLERVAFNKIKWQIVYTGTSGTGNSLLDDTLNNFCQKTNTYKNYRQVSKLRDFCSDDKVTKSQTLKISGNVDPFTANLYVPTDIYNIADATANAIGLRTNFPDQEQLVNAVSPYLPTWIEIYAAYVNSGDLKTANTIYKYYLQELEEGGELSIEVSLYALRNYEFAVTTDLGDRTTSYDIRNLNGTTIAGGLSEEQMNAFVNSSETSITNVRTEPCTKSDYFNGLCSDAKLGGVSVTGIPFGCREDIGDFETHRNGCTWGTKTVVEDTGESFFDAIKDFSSALESVLRNTWASVKATLNSAWYYAENTAKDFLYAKYPLTLAADTTWAVAVTKGSTFDELYEVDYSVASETTKTPIDRADASEGFSNDQPFTSVQYNGESKPVSNTSNVDGEGKKVVSETVIATTSSYRIVQVTSFINIKREIIKHTERLGMGFPESNEYKITKYDYDDECNVTMNEITYDNRLAYVIERLTADPSIDLVYNSDEFMSAYEAIRSANGTLYGANGVNADYSNLPAGAFGWPFNNDVIKSQTLSSCTGLRGNVFGGAGTETHGGDDIPADTGTEIVAARAGTVVVNSWDGDGYGNYIVIDHGGGWYTIYAHMVSRSPILVGDVVQGGDVIGKVGSTGRSTGPHLHFEIRYGTGGSVWSAERMEPLYYIAKSTMPENLTTYAENCPDKSTWGVPDIYDTGGQTGTQTEEQTTPQ